MPSLVMVGFYVSITTLSSLLLHAENDKVNAANKINVLIFFIFFLSFAKAGIRIPIPSFLVYQCRLGADGRDCSLKPRLTQTENLTVFESLQTRQWLIAPSHPQR